MALGHTSRPHLFIVKQFILVIENINSNSYRLAWKIVCEVLF